MKIKNNYILAFCAALLAVLCVLSVSTPLTFQREKQQRETEVKCYLRAIRTAEARYLQTHGNYTDRFGTLAKEGLLPDSVQYIPYSGGKRFHLAVSVQITKGCNRVPLMECSATYEDYLRGLDASQIANITEAANNESRFAGLKIGDLTTPNNNAGNWE